MSKEIVDLNNMEQIEYQSSELRPKGINDNEIEQAFEAVKAQFYDMPADTEGLIVFTYGNENYMVSGNAAHNYFKKIGKFLVDKYPKVYTILVPWWMKMDMLDIREFMKENKPNGT